MRILLDECVSFKVRGFLQSKGYDATHVKETAWRGRSNSDLYEEAKSTYSLFVSVDHDFRNPRKHPPTKTMGVIFIRVNPPAAREIIPALDNFLNAVPLESVIGKHVVIRRNDHTIQ